MTIRPDRPAARPTPKPAPPRPQPVASTMPLGTRMVHDALGDGTTDHAATARDLLPTSAGTGAIAGLATLIIHTADTLDFLDTELRSNIASAAARLAAAPALLDRNIPLDRHYGGDVALTAARRQDTAGHLRRLITVYRRATQPDPTDPAG
ncbi:hypothetical protein [Embleya sp. NPDC059237]|uniref:hypothetical protein n=1 Tax=Embleya sp. NPDC059237 TaxID=3346784 RepID=UPI00367BD083